MMDMTYARSEAYVSMCRNDNNGHFTRRRKLPLNDLLLSMINRKGITLKLELRNFMSITHPGMEISKPGYLKQRLKLNPEAFKELYHYHNRNFYQDTDISTYNKYLVLAADGSDINVPTTPETLDMFGTASRKGTKPQSQIGLACIYDVLNKLILESSINKVKFDEMRQAEEQLDKIRDTIGCDQPYLIIMDRGYPSTPAFIHMEDKGIKFLVRLKSSDYKKEQADLVTDDTVVDITLDKSRIRHYEGTADGERMKELGHIRLRMVRVKLDDGRYEVLATNLDREEFDADAIAELYHLRWGIETAYETLKSRLQLENFTGTKSILLEQDIYSTIYVSNLTEDIIMDVEKELDEKDISYKHKMAVNQSIGIGILKNDLIHIILETNCDKKQKMFDKLYDDISNNLVPIRPDRHYRRTKGQLAGRYSNTHKRVY